MLNAYNDGPPEPGVKPMGPFYELESSSPAKELKPGESLMHTQTTFHFQGDEKAIDRLTVKSWAYPYPTLLQPLNDPAS